MNADRVLTLIRKYDMLMFNCTLLTIILDYKRKIDMNIKRRLQRNQSGYTMAELLAVVAIISVLMAVAIIGITSIQKNLRQKEMDDKAETIYVAVQNQITKLRTSGNEINYTSSADGGNASGITKLSPDEPSDWQAPASIDAYGNLITEECNLWYLKQVTEADKSANASIPSAAYYVMSSNTVDESLRGNYWVVEYDPASAYVYSVFYWENKDEALAEAGGNDYSFSNFDKLRDYKTRKGAGGYIGYYSGSAFTGVGSISGSKEISVINGEKLYGVFQYGLSATTKSEVKFTINLEDQHEHTRELTLSSKDGALNHIGKRYYCTIMFDDLSADSTRFYNIYGKGNRELNESEPGNQPLCVGDEISVSLKVEIPEDYTFSTKTFEGDSFNSLYGNESVFSADNTTVENAVIECGRHLQNLDESAHWDLRVTGATQTNDITFKEKEDVQDNWYAFYNTDYFNKQGENVSFKPVNNINLKTYAGADQNGSIINGSEKSYHVISGLPIEATTAGLFVNIANDAKLSDIRMNGPYIRGSDNAGALFGKVSGKVAIEGCRVYLDEADGDLDDKKQTDIWISGKYAGGLIGDVAGGADISIKDSFASIVIGNNAKEKDSVAGGLIGRLDGSGMRVNIDRSYADSYMYAESASGLVGQAKDIISSGLVINTSYAAGFITVGDDGEAAGLVLGKATLKNSYAFMQHDGTDIYYSTAYKESTASNVWYYASGSTESAETDNITYYNIDDTESFADLKDETLLDKLGEDFVLSNEDTLPYNLMANSALTTYPYPRIKDIRHYGDWVSEFVPGALVYYERYLDSKGKQAKGVRFYGGNISTLYDNLKNAGAVYGDGYGIVYRSTDTRPETIKVETDWKTETITFASSTCYEYTENGITYYVYPLSMEMTNPVLTGKQSFYHRAKLTYHMNGGQDTEQLYYFNPHFARAVGYMQNTLATEMPKLSDNGVIYVRSARHLYNLSLYYSSYRNVTQGRTFRQTWELDYTNYDWAEYFNGAKKNYTISRQNPIGTANEGFNANYNGGGYRIVNISFVLSKGVNDNKINYYVGLFGKNEGTISNVVIYADYDEDGGNTDSQTFEDSKNKHYYVSKKSHVDYYVGTDENIGKNQALHMGILAGANTKKGKIINCATAGYYMANSTGTIRGYSNAYLYVGALVGDNESGGSITRCSADTPFIRITTNYANATVSGFVGRNAGNIKNSYSLGHIEVVSPRGGSIVIAGFAGSNSGEISSSYAAVNLQTSGDMTTAYPFAQTGGVAYKCSYLHIGTYSYGNHLYSYSLTGGSGTAMTYAELIANAGVSVTSASYSYDYASIKNITDSDAYPFETVVTNSAGKLVHYGDWQKKANLGASGVFYWEKEEESNNKGYHMTFIGIEEDKAISDTTLCTAHDDGGVVTAYGYGYYVKNGSVTDVTMSSAQMNIPSLGNIHAEAKNALEEEMDGFTFYPFETLPMNSAVNDKYMYLTKNVQNAEVTLTNKTTAGDYTVNYIISPFFADAMAYRGSEISDTSGFSVKRRDGETTDYTEIPGTDDNSYEVRSVAQLQYINWNSDAKNTTTLVDSTSYQKYTYLAYTSNTGADMQQYSTAKNNNINYYKQSHDVSGIDMTSGAYAKFTPIAGSNTSSSSGYNAVLYAWFGGSYDGGSYKLQNIQIETKAFSAGLFGTTVNAGLRNIIMYSDSNARIERNTTASDSNGGYSLGGLVGVAYRYNGDTSSKNTIQNCAIAGYNVIDSSKNKLTLGEANVGGLVGVADVDLLDCSAVTDIQINCTHKTGSAEWGDYIRVGGVCGALPGSATNCYSGGSIAVGTETLSESYTDKKVKCDTEKQNQVCYRDGSTNIYIAGIAGSGFSMNYQNFTGNTGLREGYPTVKNSYTYINFPDITGTIRGIAMITSLADRAWEANGNVTIQNCYYLQNSAKIDVSKAANCKMQVKDNNASSTTPRTVLGDNANFTNMINGGSAYICKCYGISKKLSDLNATDPSGPTSQKYSELSADIMPGKLGSAWGKVTTTEGGSASIDGKYSFPGNHAELDGLNYPFPTIITQKDLVFNRTVNVHYGPWPLDGIYWESARTSMDVFADRKPDEADAIHTEHLLNAESGSNLTKNSFNMENGDIVEVLSVEKVVDGDGTYAYNVSFKALKTGTETITVTDNGHTATLILEVTANLNVTTDPAEIAQSNGETHSLTLSAKSSRTDDNDYSDKVIWKVLPQDDDYAEATSVPEGSHVSNITSLESGRTQLIITATATYNGVEYTASQYVSLMTYGVIGLTNNNLGTGEVFYNECSRAVSGEKSGAEEEYSGNAPKLDNNGTADIYLYESVTDMALAKAKIQSVTIGTDEAIVTDDGENTQYTVGNYIVDIGDGASITGDSKYTYRKLKVRPKENFTGGDIKVTIEVGDGDTEAVYTLSGTITASHIVTYDVNGGDEGSLAKKYDRITTSTTAAAAPEKTGYIFTHWDTQADDEGTDYSSGDYLSGVKKDITLYAQWSPIKYSVEYKMNDSDEHAENATLKSGKEAFAKKDDIEYDTEIKLPSKNEVEERYTFPTYTVTDEDDNEVSKSYYFRGWNTKADGSGTSYSPGRKVKNLTTENGETVTLYAQWSEEKEVYTIEFYNNYEGADSNPKTVRSESDTYKITNNELPSDTLWKEVQSNGGYYQTRSGKTYKLLGWDSDRNATEPSLKIDGKNLPDVDVSGNATYYAIWEEYVYHYKLTLMNGSETYFENDKLLAGTDKLDGLSNSIGNVDYAMPTKSGYTFMGWYAGRLGENTNKRIDANGSFEGGKSLSDLAEDDYSLTLYARWYKEETIYVPISGTNPNSGKYLITTNGRMLQHESSGETEPVKLKVFTKLSVPDNYYDSSNDSNASAVTGDYIKESDITKSTDLWNYNGNNFYYDSNYYLKRSSSTCVATTGDNNAFIVNSKYLQYTTTSWGRSIIYYLTYNNNGSLSVSNYTTNRAEITYYEAKTVYVYEN